MDFGTKSHPWVNSLTSLILKRSRSEVEKKKKDKDKEHQVAAKNFASYTKKQRFLSGAYCGLA